MQIFLFFIEGFSVFYHHSRSFQIDLLMGMRIGASPKALSIKHLNEIACVICHRRFIINS